MEKRATVLVCIMVLTAGVAAGKYSGGTGEPNDPYRIATANDLNDIGNYVEDFNKCFVMVNDINLADYNGTQFKIIGNYPSNPFAGVFDGNERSITNFTYQGDASLVGLFGCVSHPNAVIKDLTLVDPNVDGGTGDLVGALAGLLESGTISSCGTVGGSVVASENVGGVVGASWGGQISNCYASGSVCGEDRAGGLVGTSSQANISHCYATGAVRGDLEIGGLVGHIEKGIVVECYASADVGGLQQIGGLAGYHKGVGSMGGIRSCYASGSVTGDHWIGGLVGTNSGYVKHCYAAGIVDANEAGGLIGHDIGPSYYTKCFWDSDVNPDVNGIGSTTDPNVIGKTTAEMQTKSTFTDAGWDFVEVWGIGENQTYPFLRVYPAGDMNHDNKVDWADLAILAGHWLEGQ
ncbi:MAG: GLUG motif-containing protein [Planctomycetota bacterium]